MDRNARVTEIGAWSYMLYGVRIVSVRACSWASLRQETNCLHGFLSRFQLPDAMDDCAVESSYVTLVIPGTQRRRTS